MKNGKIYIGKTKTDIEKRFASHLYNARKKINRPLYDSINNHGSENFEIRIIEECSSVEELNAKERFYIKNFNSQHPFGYNMTAGGEGGNTWNKLSDQKRKEASEKLSVSNTGKKRDAIARKNISVGAKKRESQKTPEEKKIIAEKISKTIKELGLGWLYTKNKPGCKGFFLGKNHSEKTKKILSDHRKGKTYEDVYGEIKAVEIKEAQRLRWTGTANPNYIEEMSRNDIRKLYDLVLNNNLKLPELAATFCLSLYTMRLYLRKMNVDNLQEFKKLNTDDRKSIIKEIL